MSLLRLPFFFGKFYYIYVIIVGWHAVDKINFGVTGSLKIFCEMQDED